MSQRTVQSLLLHLVHSPAHSVSALNCGRRHISKTHSILHLIPQTHQKTATVVSASYIFHGKRPQAQKSKAQCHHPGIQEIPESLSFITKIIYEHKQMWSTNMPINWEGRWSCCGWDTVSRDCGKQSIRGDHDPPFLSLQLGDRVWGWNPQDLNRICQCCLSETDRPIHRNKLYWVSGGTVVYPLHHQCCVFDSVFFLDSFGLEFTSTLT